MQKMGKCIECGSKDLKTVKKNLEFERRNPSKIRVSNQECIECGNCGELYFDEKQSDELARKIDKKL
jgi:YgiT-type zinc finger domain-containing protein